MSPLMEEALIGDTHTVPQARGRGRVAGAGLRAGHLDETAFTSGRWFALGTAAGSVAGIRLIRARRS